jgi:Domain of unknown function (DUF4832)/Domain of unknown function (DUF4874)
VGALLITFLMACNPDKQIEKTPPLSGLSTVVYTADLTGVFPNPERGWHSRRSIVKDRNFSDIKSAGNTLIHSYLRLDSYQNTDVIPQLYLDSLQQGLNAVRASGLKIVLRATHVWDESPTVLESRILKHIEQVNAVISANADVVNHLEAGYLGKWGEWHSGLYTELSNRNDGDSRYRIIKKILETTPNNIPVLMRYPMHIREILDQIPAPSGSSALTQEQRDRIGHHNDCFLFNDNDRGTYARANLWFGSQTLAQQKQYAFNLTTSYGGNKMVGGETCSPSIDRIGDTQKEMGEVNWTEINLDFWGDAITMWKNTSLPAIGNDPAESEFTRISRKLGYRLRLTDATFSAATTAGGNFTFTANFNNDGYSSIIKSRPIFLVFDNGTNRYNIELANIDVRKWVTGNAPISEQKVSLPANMVAGTYKLALWLPDASTKLQSQPSYSIRFANKDMWDNANGYNVLSTSVTIKN